MSFLLDTNVISEFRKGQGAKRNVVDWLRDNRDERLFLSVLTIGEIRKGIDRLNLRAAGSAQELETWLDKTRQQFAGRIIPVDQEIAEAWGAMSAGADPPPAIDALLAATALVRNLTLVTRNTRDIERAGVAWLNPFS